MMTRITVLMFALLPLMASAQLNPVSWTFESRKVSDKEYEVIMTAQCESGWYIYSQYLESEDGPIATTFTFDNAPANILEGRVTESGHKKEGYDPMFGMNITKYADKVVFTQRVKTDVAGFLLKGSVNYMTCNDEKCLPPKDVVFNIVLP